uniref:Uncharacterized protein LOC110202530 n=1 Tax=Phascolarctos cinereus TaxID=38626 RepID=A0A6P5JTT6_PHACI|nr:uncharacterized protein LOC110202530 [Phascolarctos cinereus]
MKEKSGLEVKMSDLYIQNKKKRRRMAKRRRSSRRKDERNKLYTVTYMILTTLILGLQITQTVAEENTTRWAFVTKPPWPRVVTWEETLPEVILQGSVSQGLGKEFNFVSTGNNSKPTIKFNFTGLALAPPLCVTKTNNTRNICVQLKNLTFRFEGTQFNETGPTKSIMHFQHFNITMLGIKGQWCDNSTPIMRPTKYSPCYLAMWPDKKEYPPWLDCVTAERHCININGTTLQSWHNYTKDINDSHTYSPAFGGYPKPAWILLNGKVEDQLWKAWAALGPIHLTSAWKRQESASFSDVACAQACLLGQFAFMWGKENNITITKLDSGEYNVTCMNCSVSECRGSKINDQLIFIVTQQKFALIPVKSKEWYHTRADHIFGIIEHKSDLVLRRQKRCISCVALGIVSLIALISSTVSIALSISTVQNEIVQVEFLNELAKNVSIGFATQKHIDTNFYHILEGMKETIIEIGDELDILEYCTHLQCD